MNKLLAIVPARAGSKGLPGKNMRPFAGLPLIEHTLRCALMIGDITELVVSSDDMPVLQHALNFAQSVGADNFHVVARPPELAQDDSPIWPVIRHVLKQEEYQGTLYDYVLLLEPTSPLRRPEWIGGALALLKEHERADGVHGVSETSFNPIWNCVLEKNGWMSYLVPEGRFYTRRQDVPPTYKMDGSLHIWRAGFVRETDGGYHWGQYVLYKTDPAWALSIDTLDDFNRGQALVSSGLVELPWLKEVSRGYGTVR